LIQTSLTIKNKLKNLTKFSAIDLNSTFSINVELWDYEQLELNNLDLIEINNFILKINQNKVITNSDYISISILDHNQTIDSNKLKLITVSEPKLNIFDSIQLFTKSKDQTAFVKGQVLNLIKSEFTILQFIYFKNRHSQKCGIEY
jgi:hypothetical protein